MSKPRKIKIVACLPTGEVLDLALIEVDYDHSKLAIVPLKTGEESFNACGELTIGKKRKD